MGKVVGVGKKRELTGEMVVRTLGDDGLDVVVLMMSMEGAMVEVMRSEYDSLISGR